MDSLLSGPYVSVMVLAALVVFVWLFWDLMEEMRDGAADLRVFGPFWRRRARKPSARASRGFERASAPPPPRGRESLQFSRTLETWIDRESGEITGRVMAGAYRGRGLEQLSRTDCLRLNEYCLRADPEAARLLEAYVRGRFAGASRAKPSGEQSPPPANVEGMMTRQHAYEVLGLASVAGEREIIKAHRALIKKHHPDRGGSTTKAAMINRAKDILIDKKDTLIDKRT
jgi:DnaJ domain